MPTPKRRGGCGTAEALGSMVSSGSEGKCAGSGRSRERPPSESGREEACDQRSLPQDVTSSWAGRGGVNLQPEVAPQPTERPPRDSPLEDTPDGRPGVK